MFGAGGFWGGSRNSGLRIQGLGFSVWGAGFFRV